MSPALAQAVAIVTKLCIFADEHEDKHDIPDLQSADMDIPLPNLLLGSPANSLGIRLCKLFLSGGQEIFRRHLHLPGVSDICSTGKTHGSEAAFAPPTAIKLDWKLADGYRKQIEARTRMTSNDPQTFPEYHI